MAFLLHFARKNVRVCVGIAIVLTFVLMALIGYFIPNIEGNVSEAYQGPSSRHLLGTDYAGRDILLQIVKGATDVLVISFLIALMTTSIGVIVGLTSGYVGGLIDSILTSIMNIILTIPSMPLLMVIASLIKMVPNPFVIAGILSSIGWAGQARAIRSQVLSIKEEEYIEAARILGLRKIEILFNEVLVALLPYIAMNFILSIISAIYSQVGMYYLGVLPFSSYNWGMMMNIARSHGNALWCPSTVMYLVGPMVCIVLLAQGFTMLLPLIDLLNPRLREE